MKKTQTLILIGLLISLAAPVYAQEAGATVTAVKATEAPTATAVPISAAVPATAAVPISAAVPAVTSAGTATQTQQLPAFDPSQEPFSMEIAAPKPAGARQFNFDLAPGSSAEDTVIIKNFSNHTIHFSLYAADPTVTNTGSPAYKTRGETTSKGPAVWIKFEEPEIDLPAMSAMPVKFTVTVPSDAARDNYRAGIAMEKSKKDTKNAGITINARFIIQANIKVDGAAVAGAAAGGQQDGWRPFYFAGSAILFILCVGLLTWLIIHDKFTKKKKAGHAKPIKAAKKRRAKK
jgi:hypothetical protein